MDSNNILIKIGADITAFSRSMRQATSELDAFQQANKETFDSFKKVGGAITGIGVGIGATLGASVKVASDFQSAFAGVRKTVDASEAEFAELEKGIRDMSKVLPASAVEIAAVAEAAGQLGIEKENILDFTRTMIDLGEATNLSADEAATQFARFANIVGMPQDSFDKLGSSVVALGNNFATTEAEIVAMGMRISGTGAQIGLTEAEIMALAASMSSVGIEAEAGGTAMSMVMKKMQNAISLAASGSKNDLKGFASAAGMSADEFAKTFESRPIEAIDAFIKGLAESGKEGKNLNAILDDVNIKGIREADTMLRLAGASELLGDAVSLSTEAWNENSALSDEAAQRYETFASKLDMFKNAITDVGVTVGNVLLPFVTDLVDKLSGMVDWFTNLNPKIVEASVIFAAVAGGIALIAGPILLLIGFIPAIISGFTAIGTVISAVTAFFAPAAAGAGAVAGATSGLGTVMAALTGPIGIAVAAVVGIIAALVLAYNKVDWFRELVNDAWEKIKNFTKQAFNFVKDIIKTVISEAVKFGSELLDKFRAFWDENGKAIVSLVKIAFYTIYEQIKLVMGFIKAVFEVVWPIISNIIKIAWDAIKLVIGTAIDIVLGVIQTAMKLLQGDWSGAWETIKETADTIWKNIISFFEGIDLQEIGKDILRGLIKGFTSMVDTVTDTVKNIAGNIKNAITDFFDIHSPSRVMAGIGKNIGEGLAIGIDATKAVNKSAISGLADVIKSVAVASNAEMAEINKKAAADEKAVREKAAKDIEYIYANAKERKRKLTLAESMRIERIEADEVARVKKIHEDANKALYREAVENDKRRLSAIKDFVSEKKSLEQISLIDEVNIWRKSVEHFEDGTDAKVAAQIEYKNAIKRVNDEIASINEKFSKRMADISGKLTDDITRANEELATKSKAIKDKLIADEQRLNDEYAKAFEQRYNALRNFAGLFDKFDMSPKETGGELLDNLKSQVDGFKSWESQIATLSERAIDDGLLDELRQMGPKALPQLLALNSMTDDQLTQYSGLYREKSAMARTETERQMAGMKADTQRQLSELRAVANAELTQLNIETQRNIASMRAVANAELATLQTEWTRSIQSVTKATDDEFQTLTQIGKNAGQNLLDGLASMESSLVAKATSIARAVNSALQSTLGGSVSVAPYKTPTPAKGVGSTVQTSSTAATAGGITQNITINSPTALSPAETARLNKQASQRLAMEVGLR